MIERDRTHHVESPQALSVPATFQALKRRVLRCAVGMFAGFITDAVGTRLRLSSPDGAIAIIGGAISIIGFIVFAFALLTYLRSEMMRMVLRRTSWEPVEGSHGPIRLGPLTVAHGYVGSNKDDGFVRISSPLTRGERPLTEREGFWIAQRWHYVVVSVAGGNTPRWAFRSTFGLRRRIVELAKDWTDK